MAAVQRQTSMLDFFSSPADRTISTKRKRSTSPEDISRCETVLIQRNPMSPEVISMFDARCEGTANRRVSALIRSLTVV